MTDKELNIAIAEAVGLFKLDPNDLNAMHKAEESLPSKLDYLKNLHVVCGGTPLSLYAHLPDILHAAVFFRATARQRAEAFLKTTGKIK